MKIVKFDHDAVTLTLDPADCFLLAEACRAAVNFDAATNLAQTDLMEALMTAAGTAASTHATISGLQDKPLAEVRAVWLPQNDRYVH